VLGAQDAAVADQAREAGGSGAPHPTPYREESPSPFPEPRCREFHIGNGDIRPDSLTSRAGGRKLLATMRSRALLMLRENLRRWTPGGNRTRAAAVACGILLIFSQGACGKTAPIQQAPRSGVVSRDAVSRDAVSRDALPGNVVVRVGEHSITKATVSRWTKVEAVLTHENRSGPIAPRGLVPDPPRFTNCIEYLATSTDAEQTGQRSDRLQLKRLCAERDKNLREQALLALITHYWVSGEAAKRHVNITDDEIRKEKDRKFLAKGGRRSLEAAGVRPADERFFVESQVLLAKLQRSTLPVYAELRRAVGPETPGMVNRVDAEIQRLSDEMTRRWTPRTQCRTGFVVSECSEYKGAR
jgi:hypothetical protein